MYGFRIFKTPILYNFSGIYFLKCTVFGYFNLNSKPIGLRMNWQNGRRKRREIIHFQRKKK